MKMLSLMILGFAALPAMARADQQYSCKKDLGGQTVIFTFSKQNQQVSYKLDGLAYDLPFTGFMEAAMVFEAPRYIPIYGQRAVTVAVPEATLQAGAGPLVLDNSVTSENYYCTAR